MNENSRSKLFHAAYGIANLLSDKSQLPVEGTWPEWFQERFDGIRAEHVYADGKSTEQFLKEKSVDGLEIVLKRGLIYFVFRLPDYLPLKHLMKTAKARCSN